MRSWTLDLDLGLPCHSHQQYLHEKDPQYYQSWYCDFSQCHRKPYWFNSDLAADQNDFLLDTKIVCLKVDKPHHIGKIHLSLYFAANRNLLSFTIECCLFHVR